MSVVISFDVLKWHKKKTAAQTSGMNGISLRGDNGAAVILIHGLTGTPNEMKFLAAYLHKRGYSVICPRLANHGEPLHVLKYSKWQEFYASVRRVMTEGELASFNGPVFAAGLSLGALLSLILADEFKDRVSGVSCLAPTLFYDGWNTPGSSFFLPLGYRTFVKHFTYFKEEPPYGIKNEAVRARIHRYYNNARMDNLENVAQYGYPYFPVTLLHQLQLLVKHVSSKLPGISLPVQMIQAKDDDMTSVKNSKFIYDNIVSEMKEIILLYDSYHVITADQERDVVAAKMEDFFARVLASHK